MTLWHHTTVGKSCKNEQQQQQTNTHSPSYLTDFASEFPRKVPDEIAQYNSAGQLSV